MPVKPQHTVAYIAAHLFAGLGMVCIPFSYTLFSFQEKLISFIFSRLIAWVGAFVWDVSFSNLEISSDSGSMYVLMSCLLGLSVLLAVRLVFLPQPNRCVVRLLASIRLLACYYLSLHLLSYGLNKVFKYQFYLPEPNILYTPLGQIDRDLLFWSTMGSSYGYNLFLGLLEVIPALLLLYRKTRVLGLLLALGVTGHVVAINFSFDISVKLFSSFLCFLCVLTLWPQLSRLYLFLVHQQSTALLPEPEWLAIGVWWKRILKLLVLVVIFLEAFVPYLQSGNWNDDLAQRPYLHGAWQVKEMITVADTQAALTLPIKRLFIHRNGYLIIQRPDDAMQDFALRIDSVKKQFILTNYQLYQLYLPYQYHPKDSTLELHYFDHGQEYLLKTKALNWKSLPLLRNDFHWVVGEE